MLDHVQKHFSERAATYDSGNWVRNKELLLAHTEIVKGLDIMQILDVGCGTGVLGEQFRKDGVTVFGVDLTLDMLMLARKRLSFVAMADAHCLPFSSATFDLIVFRQVLHYLQPSRAIDESIRTLTKQGYLLISTTVPYGELDTPWFMERVHLMKPFQTWTPTTQSILDLSDKFDFNVVKIVNVQTCSKLSFITSRTQYEQSLQNQAINLYTNAPNNVKSLYKMKFIDNDVEYWVNWAICLFQKKAN